MLRDMERKLAKRSTTVEIPIMPVAVNRPLFLSLPVNTQPKQDNIVGTDPPPNNPRINTRPLAELPAVGGFELEVETAPESAGIVLNPIVANIPRPMISIPCRR